MRRRSMAGASVTRQRCSSSIGPTDWRSSGMTARDRCQSRGLVASPLAGSDRQIQVFDPDGQSVVETGKTYMYWSAGRVQPEDWVGVPLPPAGAYYVCHGISLQCPRMAWSVALIRDGSVPTDGPRTANARVAMSARNPPGRSRSTASTRRSPAPTSVRGGALTVRSAPLATASESVRAARSVAGRTRRSRTGGSVRRTRPSIAPSPAHGGTGDGLDRRRLP